MNTSPKEEADTRSSIPPEGSAEETRKDVPTLKERVEMLEEQIKQTIGEYERLADIVEKLKIINTLLYKEVCREYTSLNQNNMHHEQ